MEGKIYFTMLGLFLALAISSLLAGIESGFFVIEVVLAAWFLLVFILFMFIYFKLQKYAYSMSLFSFAVGILNAIGLAFVQISLWSVVLLVLSLAGIVLVTNLLSEPKKRMKPNNSADRKSLLDKELPEKENVEVVVYEAKKPVKKKKLAKKKSAKKKTTKKSSKKSTKKRVTKKSTRKVAKKKVAKKKSAPKKSAKKKK